MPLHSRIKDWLKHMPASGVRAMCAWERFCAFAREPERRGVAGDATVSAEGVSYQLQPELTGETVTLWWRKFDQEAFVQFEDKRSQRSFFSRAAFQLDQEGDDHYPTTFRFASLGAVHGRLSGRRVPRYAFLKSGILHQMRLATGNSPSFLSLVQRQRKRGFLERGDNAF